MDWPGSAEFYSDLAARTATEERVRLYRLNGVAGPIGSQFCLVAGGTAHWRLPARNLDPEAERLGSGTVGLVKMIDNLITEGVSRIEAGRGEYSYKLDYAGRNVPVHRLIVRPGTPFAALRLKLLLGWADLLNLLYYRIWFQRLAPRYRKLTGAKPRPLWRSWIRTRL
ncbi:MAG: GNAT family N-acetyltransferase [Paracoccaceae bacterium]